MNPKALYNITYGLYMLSAQADGMDNACIINTAAQIANDPTRIGISVIQKNLTHDMILESGEFNISAISSDAPFDLFKQFGMQSARDVEKFRGYPGVDRAQNTLPILSRHGNMYLSVYVDQVLDLGSHTLFIGQILDGEVLSDKPSCSYSHYQTRIKPQTKKAATKQWECRICGHIYEGEEVPDDYLCPLCKHGKEDFVPVG